MTVVIWDTVEADIKFFVVRHKDVSHLDRNYANDADMSEEMSSEISNLVYNEEGQTIQEMSTTFPIDAVLAGANVIVTGFLP